MKITLKDILDLIEAGNAMAENLSEWYSGSDDVPEEIENWDDLVTKITGRIDMNDGGE